MKKYSLVVLFLILIPSVFIYGVLVGTYKIYPYDLMDSAKSIISNEKNILNEENSIVKNDVKSLISIKSESDIFNLKNNLIDFIWKDKRFPYSKLPDSVQSNILDSRYAELNNLKRIDQIKILMEYEVDSVSYLFIPESSNGKLIIYHQGHGGDFYRGKETIQFFLEKDFSVLAFSMPLLGMNNQPIIETNNFGKIKLVSHEHFRFLDSSDFSSIKFFIEPIAVSLNYLDKEYEFSSYHMVGISGGGWTTTIYPAIDERISKSYSIAGSLPIYLRTNPQNYGDYEQWLPELYQQANYLEIYVMNSYGENREFTQIFNKYDPCCFSGDLFKSYENEVEELISELGSGSFVIYLDDTHKKHEISETTLEFIFSSLKN